LHSNVKNLSKQVSGQGVTRIQKQSQLVSIPNHNYQLKMRKMFRIDAITAGATTVPLSLNGIRDAICEEMGFTLVVPGITSGMTFTVHGFRVYATAPTGFANLAVSVYDIEESSTSNASLIALFEDNSTNAGVAHVAGTFALNNRPTFNRTTADNVILQVVVPIGHFFVVDLDVTVIRTPTVFPSLRTLERSLPSLNPSHGFSELWSSQNAEDQEPSAPSSE
jgi:hypothetical protein